MSGLVFTPDCEGRDSRTFARQSIELRIKRTRSVVEDGRHRTKGANTGFASADTHVVLGGSASTWSIPVGPIGDFRNLLEHAGDAVGSWISPLEPLLPPCDPLLNAAAIDLGGERNVH